MSGAAVIAVTAAAKISHAVGSPVAPSRLRLAAEHEPGEPLERWLQR